MILDIERREIFEQFLQDEMFNKDIEEEIRKRDEIEELFDIGFEEEVLESFIQYERY